MKFLFLSNTIVCADDPKLIKLSEDAKPFQMKFVSLNQQIEQDATVFYRDIKSLFKNSVDVIDQTMTLQNIEKDLKKAQSVMGNFFECVAKIGKSLIDMIAFGDPNTMDSATKQQLQEVVRGFGDQISELEKLSKEVQTTEFSTNMVKLFKSKYESKFESGAITKFEEIDKAYEKFNNAFKKLLADEHKHVFALYKYLYNKAAVEAGISMSSTTKWILFATTGVLCIAILAVFGWFAYKTYKEHDARVKKEREEDDEVQYSYIDQSHGHYNNHHSHYQDHQQHPYSEQPRVGQLENSRNYYNR